MHEQCSRGCGGMVRHTTRFARFVIRKEGDELHFQHGIHTQ